MVCVLCEKKGVETWFGSFCAECRKIKNLGNVYGFERTLEILEKCCIRNTEQLEKKIDTQKKIKEEIEVYGDDRYSAKPPNTRSQVKKI